MIETKLYYYNPKNTGVELINTTNGAVIIVPREEIITVARRMLTIYENTKKGTCPEDEKRQQEEAK